jgi:hypothetical protein
MALKSVRFASNQRFQRAAEDNPPIRYGEGDKSVVAELQRVLVVLGLNMPKSTKPNGFMDLR